jgi:hypothetical protein
LKEKGGHVLLLTRTPRRLYVSTTLVVLLVCFLSSPGFNAIPNCQASSEWVSGWQFRKSHVINPATGAGQDYQVCIKAYKGTGVDGVETVYGVSSGRVFLGSGVRDDFGDVRFTGSDGTTELKYWLQQLTYGISGVFWVKIADSLESSPVTIHIYYGKSDATTTSSPYDTFAAFADFEASTDGWTNIDSDILERTDSQSFGGSYSLHCKRTAAADKPANAFKAISLPSTFCYQLAFRISGTAELELSVYYSGAVGYENGVRLYAYGGGLKYKLGSNPSQSCGVSYSTNVWYNGQIRRTNTSNWELAYYNSSGSSIWEKTDCSFAPTQTIDRLGVSLENDNDLYIDNNFVRKYTGRGNEPAHGAWGNEETPPRALLRLNPSIVERNSSDIGTLFNLSVTIQDITDLWGLDYNLTWDSSLLTLMSVNFDMALDFIWGCGNWFVASNSSGTGYYKLAAVSTLNGFNSTDSVSLTVLTFRSEDPLTSYSRNTSIHFDTHKLSNSNYQQILHTTEDGIYKITGKTPTLRFSPDNRTCRKYDEKLSIAINISDLGNLTGFAFEIHYNTMLLDYSGITWNTWGNGSIAIDEASGKMIGNTSGVQQNGAFGLVTIEFKATCLHIWKNLPDWINDQTGIVFVQQANLSCLGAPDLQYARGDLNQINIGPDFTYTFSPIQGDVDNDGMVDIFDLRTVAAYYDQVNETYNLIGSNVIDVFDLVIIGSNLGFEYDP